MFVTHSFFGICGCLFIVYFLFLIVRKQRFPFPTSFMLCGWLIFLPYSVVALSINLQEIPNFRVILQLIFFSSGISIV